MCNRIRFGNDWQKNGGLKLIKKLIIIPLVLLFILAACPSLAQSLNNSTNETNIRDASSPQESRSLANESSVSIGTAQNTSATSATSFNESEQAPVPNLSYIWSVTGIEPSQVIMVLKQEGQNLYGQAKYEPDSGQSWNGVVVGSVEGNRVDLVLTSQNGTEVDAAHLKGNFTDASQSIKGDLIKVSNGHISERSNFEAVWINPDISSYTPAVVPIPRATSTVSGQEARNTTPQIPAENSATARPKSYFHDVRQDADRILTGVGDISQIPIGMGGSGLA
jgi:hypothetical protein